MYSIMMTINFDESLKKICSSFCSVIFAGWLDNFIILLLKYIICVDFSTTKYYRSGIILCLTFANLFYVCTYLEKVIQRKLYNKVSVVYVSKYIYAFLRTFFEALYKKSYDNYPTTARVQEITLTLLTLLCLYPITMFHFRM